MTLTDLVNELVAILPKPVPKAPALPKAPVVQAAPKPKPIAQTPQPKKPLTNPSTAPQVPTPVAVTVLKDIGTAATVSEAGRTLFGEGNQFLSASQILALLKILGVKVPPNAQIAVDVAQLAVAGGAVASSAEVGASWGSYCSPAGAGILAIVDILSLSKVITPNDPNVILVKMVADLALIIGSCGTNIGAWVGLVLDEQALAGEAAGKAAFQAGKQKSAEMVRDMFLARESAQYAAAAKNIAAYHDGTLGTFDFINQVAKDSPDYFNKIMPPGYSAGMDPVTITFYASYTKINWWGHVDASGDYTWHYNTLGYNRQKMQDFIFATLVAPTVDPFIQFEKMNQDVSMMNINQLGLLATTPPYLNFISPGQDIGEFMRQACITPGDLGSQLIENVINRNSLYSYNQDFEAGVIINGVSQRDAVTQLQYDNTLMYKGEMDKIIAADHSGNMDFLLKIDGIKAQIANWSDIVNTNSQYAYTGYNPFSPQNGQAVLSGFRYPQYYVKSLQLIDQMQKSEILNSYASPFAKYLTRLDEFQNLHKDIATKAIARAANRKALTIIASFFGTTPDKIEMVNKLADGTPAQFRVIP